MPPHTSTPPIIRPVRAGDAHALAAIYNHYVAHTVVTFEEEPVTAAEMLRRVQDVQARSLPWLVADELESVRGYAYATPWKARSAYRFSAECTVYLDAAHVGRGLGSLLYAELFRLLEAAGIHTVLGGIALPNDASVALHERFGMRQVAELKEVGFQFGRWVDVGYWQRTW
jgi:L-amino acid N-acyltransferase YncA